MNLDDASLNYRSDISPSWDLSSQLENDDAENELSVINKQTEISGQDIDNRNNQIYSEAVSSQLQAIILSDSESDSKIRY